MIEYLLSVDYAPFTLSFKLALITTLILFVLCMPLAWYLSQTKSKSKPFIEALCTMPLVVPPTVLGFYLLWGLSHNSPIGQFFQNYFGISLVFNLNGIIIASCLYSLPFMVQPLQSGFESLNKNMIEASYISGKSKFKTVLLIALPNIKPSLLTALIITFAHTVGEFGVVLMIGGSIPNETRVAAIAIYEFVEILDYKNAHIYSLIMIVMSFITLLAVYLFNGKQKRNRVI
ncbi:Sulfate transport system permease protein CysT [Aliarcobacter thereius]|uniref:Molybdenum transport system permease n=2 Tax=Aliarcobacter thereius TaxID=544718 RepID=A0A1C0BA50_9BACT|nr:molybdate ABC transporter permease subunit [Aliarcobacter thereius]OCL88401.1 Sulfate transport system permease protein CysT [Aliarcobacter thereius]OCL91891.1 Sulfate transport system permease protein CysT [Aliarcobacter thereius]OCL95011.1 Sulfate transport system permease protein CysT [Aliarcobacter thereius LMG 24486]OCM00459.1 Sulfate transport system permease protein CysT [Aliarcobacter thereius]QBF15118.1 molybdenum ABC transporter ModABC, permease protein [Aliarcobacter thereius LMG